MTKKTLLLLSTALALNFQSAWGMETPDIDIVADGKQKYLIKNTKLGEYLYLADVDKINGARVAQGSEGIFKKSIFTFNNTKEGCLIKNVKHNEYLFVSDSDRLDGNRVVKSDKRNGGTSYFTILKNEDGEGYKIKNNKHHEYFLLSYNSKISKDRVVKSWDYLDTNSYFSFIKYNENWF